MKSLETKCFFTSLFFLLLTLTSYCQDSLKIVCTKIDSVDNEYLILGRELETNNPFILVWAKNNKSHTMVSEMAIHNNYSFSGEKLNYVFTSNMGNNTVTYKEKKCFESGENVTVFYVDK